MKQLLSFLFLLTLTSNRTFGAEVNLTPSPKYMNVGKGNASFFRVSVDFSAGANDMASMTELKNFFGPSLKRAGYHGPGEFTIHGRLAEENVPARSGIPVEMIDSALASNEGYLLVVGVKGADIVAKTTAGIFYGITTFLQLVRKTNKTFIVPRIVVADYPLLKLRGISDDISRGQISTMANFKKIIRFLAAHKMNVYMPYIENLFNFKSFPDFSAGRDPLTAEQVNELDEYARMYHVQVIPVFETLGHLEDVLEKPEFSQYAEFPGAASLNISSDSAFDFMKNLLSEIAPAFSSEYFNMAADESFDVGLGASKSLVDSIGIAEAHAQFYVKLYNVLKSMGKKVMMYGDIILKNPDILSHIPKDITIVDWHYGASFDYPSIKAFRDAGFNVIACPAVWNFTGPFPNFYNSYSNIENFTRQGYEAGAIGVIVSTWNDNGAAELRELNYPGYAWGAECAWDPPAASPASFEKTFFEQYFQSESVLPRLAFELLSSVNNQVTWNEFWRAPFLNLQRADASLRMESIGATMPEVINLTSQASRIVGTNRDVLEIYALVARMNLYWADRVRGVMEMRRLAADSTIAHSVKKKKISAIEKNLLTALRKIKTDYVRIYLRTNRKPMLQLIERRFGDQEAALNAGTDQLLGGNLKFDQKIPSKFIYYPGSHPYLPEPSKIDTATFVKTARFDEIAGNAEAQLIGDTYCRLFVNGNFVGEVKARRTLTWNVEMKRVKVFNIRKYLKQGENTFLIQSENYDVNGSAGCNLLVVNGVDTVYTDSTWSVAAGLVAPAEIGNQRTVKAAMYDNGWTVSAPDFALKLKSWIER